MMAHLWSGRFEGDPDAALFAFGASFGFDRRLFEDDVRGSLAWAEGARARPACCRRRTRRDSRRAAGDSRAGAAIRRSSSRGRTRRRRRARVRRARARRAHRRRRAPPAHRALAQRAGRRRSAALPEAPHPGPAAAHRRARRRSSRTRPRRAGDALMPSYTHLRRAQPVLAAHFFPRARRGAAARSRAGSTALLDEADELPLGSGAIAGTSYAIDVHALAERLGFSRIVRNSIDATGDRDFVASFLHAAVADDGAPQPAGRGSDSLHVRRVRVLRARRHGGDRQQPDAAEEESRSARARARQGRPRHRPPDRLAGDDEGAADRLQQGSAGRQGSAVRRGRHAVARSLAATAGVVARD